MGFYFLSIIFIFGLIVYIFYALQKLQTQNYILKKKLEILEEKIGFNQLAFEPKKHKNLDKEVDFVHKKALHVKEKAKMKEEEKAPFFIVKFIKNYSLKGNLLVKLGGAILFVGLSFLLKFAISSDMLSIEVGLFLVGIFGILLVGVGLRYRKKEGHFGVLLQGIGVGVFYLDIFAASKFFTLLSPLFALLLMVLAVVGAVLLAIKQDSLPLAMVAILGGFLAPILLASNSANYLFLFGYYSVLNVGILLICFKKSWRILNLVGFFFTFLVGFVWGYLHYESHMFSKVEPFVVFFFLLYVLIGFLFAKKVALRAYIDTVLIFGTPVSFLIFQNFLSKDFDHLLSLSSLGAGLLYLSLAYLAKKDTKRPLLFDSYLVLGVIFLSFIVAFEFSRGVVSWIYAFEASGIIWISFRQNRAYSRYLAFLLTLYAVQNYLLGVKLRGIFIDTKGSMIWFAILGTALFLSAYMYRYYKDKTVKGEAGFESIYFYGGLVLWLGGGLMEIGLFELPNSLIFYFASLFVFVVVSTNLGWEKFEKSIGYLLPFGLLIMFYFVESLKAPLRGDEFLVVLLVFLVFYFIIHTNKKLKAPFWHVVGFWSIGIVLSRQLLFLVDTYDNFSLSLTTFSIVPLLSVGLVLGVEFFKKLFKEKTPLAIYGLLLLLSLWWVVSLFGSGGFEGFRYVPFFNPLDFVEILFVGLLYFSLKSLHVKKELLLWIVVGCSLVLVALFLARFIHEYLHVSYHLKALWTNNTLQSALSILYTLISFGAILFAKKHKRRDIWIGGASLLGFVIAKLFFVELASSQTLQRVVSFIGVGVIILLIGFIAPIPPKKGETRH